MLKKSRKNDKHTLWMVSNCNSTPGAIARWNYGQSLIEAGLKVEGEGACFKNGRSDKNFNSQTYGDPSVESRVHFYKFYLAFENAFHCTDYISEKFWRNSLSDGMVPIVFGSHINDLIKIAPPNSFIHSDNFKSPNDLVNYLNYLDSNITAYMEYHSWRRLIPSQDSALNDSNIGFSRLSTSDQNACLLCRLIRNKRKSLKPKSVYKSVSSALYLNISIQYF